MWPNGYYVSCPHSETVQWFESKYLFEHNSCIHGPNEPVLHWYLPGPT